MNYHGGTCMAGGGDAWTSCDYPCSGLLDDNRVCLKCGKQN